MHATTLSSTTLMVWKTLKFDYELDADALFIQAGLDPQHLHNECYRYPDENILKLWNIIFEVTQDDCIGLKVAQHIHPTTLHALGYAWLSSSTLYDALQRLVLFYRIVTDMEKLELTETEDLCKLKNIPKTTNVLITNHDYDLYFAALVIMCRDICGADYQPMTINMMRDRPNCSNKLKKFFGIMPNFSCDENAIYFDKHTIKNPLPTANAILARSSDEIITHFIAELDKADIVMQVKSKLVKQLSSGHASESEVASSLFMSTRTLQRKLSDVSRSYKDIMDETRRQLAVEYVRGENVPMTEITFLLGYSEQANFTRAFRRWTGQTPTEFRKAL